MTAHPSWPPLSVKVCLCDMTSHSSLPPLSVNVCCCDMTAHSSWLPLSVEVCHCDMTAHSSWPPLSVNVYRCDKTVYQSHYHCIKVDKMVNKTTLTHFGMRNLLNLYCIDLFEIIMDVHNEYIGHAICAIKISLLVKFTLKWSEIMHHLTNYLQFFWNI